MKAFLLLVFGAAVLLAPPTHARPNERPALSPGDVQVDVVGDVDGTFPAVQKASLDTIWIATWNFEGCDDTGWVRSDNRILNDGNLYWEVDTDYSGIANIIDEAASVTSHDQCSVCPDGYRNSWYQGICIRYVGDSYLSFDYLVDSEGGFDFLQVETDSACASFDQIDFDADPLSNSARFRDLIWAASGFDTVTAHKDSLFLQGYATADTHCAYIAFYSDGAYSCEDGLQPTVLGAGAVVDNIVLEGAHAQSEDFSAFTPSADLQFVNMQDSAPFGVWARLYPHITDNDQCTENPTCAWLSTDHTTPTFANDPSMAFAPGGYVIKNWMDEVIVGPWVNLASTSTAIATVVQFNRFPGNFFSTSKIAHNWSIRSRAIVANVDSPAPGDSTDCVTDWGHALSFNTLNTFSWLNLTWDATDDLTPNATDIQMRLRTVDYRLLNNGSLPNPFRPGPGPFWDRLRLGRMLLSGPVIDEGIDARYQAQDAAPNDPAFPSGPMYAQAAGGDIFGTTAFSMSNDLGGGGSPNLIVGDSITVEVLDVLGHGGLSVELHAVIAAGPHAGKAPPPYVAGANGFFTIPADSSRSSSGILVDDNYFVDMDDTYFRGGDVLRYFWWATDGQGGATSNPEGLTALPATLLEAERATGGLFEVSFLPAINWDPTYLFDIAADPHGDFDPTPQQLANSLQRNCILYYENINSRRRSSDLNRTSFMYTLDRLGYRNRYDVYDHSGLGNTNNALGARMSPEQAKNYSILIYDAGNRGPGAPILPDGSDLDVEKIDLEAWFQSWNALSGAPNAEHTLWILGSNVMQERPLSPLYTSDMAAVFTAANQSEDVNPDVFGVANFTNHLSCVQNHTGEQFALHGGCPTVRDYDDLAASGSGVVTHRYGKGAAGTAGAIVMNANAAGYSTILSSFPILDISASIGQPPVIADDILLSWILGCALPLSCQEAIDPVDVGPGDDDLLDIPSRTALHQNSPNPFNPTTTISFDLARDAVVSLNIYDVAGRLVRTLTDEPMTAGFNKLVPWNGLDNEGKRVSSGVYFYRLSAADFTATRKMVIMK